jgi:tetratricopeptide (TPR) repeat protein
VATFFDYDWKEAERCFRLALADNPVSTNVCVYYSLYLLVVGRPVEAVKQTEFGMQEDPLNPILRINLASYLAAAGCEEEADEEYHEILKLNPSMVLAKFNLAGRHASRGEMEQALRLCEEAYALAPLPRVIGLLAGLLKRSGNTHRAEELLGKLQPDDGIGVPLGRAIYHWALREFDSQADWMEKAIDQRDPVGPVLLRIVFGRELRTTPRWAGLMRKLYLPE